MFYLKLAGASALALAAAAAASAQTHGGEPGFGSVRFDGAAQAVPARAGGALSLEGLGCYGFSTIEPTAAVDITEAQPFSVAAGSDVDLTLAVRTPGGEVLCSDDDAGNLNPGLSFDAPAPGRYEIWVGTYGAGEGYPPIALNVTPDGFDTSNPYIVSATPGLAADQALRLSGGFRNDPRTLPVSAGGPAQMSGLDGACYGRTSEAPALALDYGGGELPLYFLLEGEEDTTIAVVTPSGEVVCNDDAVELNAGVTVASPEAGRYEVFAGLLNTQMTEARAATLSISEIGYGGVDRRLDVAGDPEFGEHRLDGGFLPDPAGFQVQAGGPIDLSMSLNESEMMGGWCAGYATRTPTLRIIYDGPGPLHISAESGADTTLAVNGPDGAWACDDDSLGDLNPAVTFEAAGAGVYDVYAGVFSDTERAPATVYVSEIAPGADPAARVMDYTLPAEIATLSLASGFPAEDGRFEIAAGGPARPGDTGEAWCTGHYTNAPSVELEWAGGSLTLTTEGELDSTLAVNLPDGSWACDDDGGDGVLSMLELAGDAGVYDIWVGTYSSGDPQDAVLVIRE